MGCAAANADSKAPPCPGFTFNTATSRIMAAPCLNDCAERSPGQSGPQYDGRLHLSAVRHVSRSACDNDARKPNHTNSFSEYAGVAKLADAQDLKSWDSQGSCGFDSRPRHCLLSITSMGPLEPESDSGVDVATVKGRPCVRCPAPIRRACGPEEWVPVGLPNVRQVLAVDE